uniref:Uncharacterized protein n=1 Tax=Arundo donax TaxID=35708 RepID=A0A0A9BQ41_ARUDO
MFSFNCSNNLTFSNRFLNQQSTMILHPNSVLQYLPY